MLSCFCGPHAPAGYRDIILTLGISLIFLSAFGSVVNLVKHIFLPGKTQVRLRSSYKPKPFIISDSRKNHVCKMSSSEKKKQYVLLWGLWLEVCVIL